MLFRILYMYNTTKAFEIIAVAKDLVSRLV